MDTEGFDKKAGPSFPPKFPPIFGSHVSSYLPYRGNSSMSHSISQPYPQRTAVSPPRWDNHSRSQVNAHYGNNGNAQPGSLVEKFTYQVPKRSRSPSMTPSSSYKTLPMHPTSQDDAEREIQAKARRLARFGDELKAPLESSHDVTGHKYSVTKTLQSPVVKPMLSDESTADQISDFPSSISISEKDGSYAVIGMCMDMCPESEREERERKCDLDPYERLDGERNQTNKYIAVKKYNRTAERDAYLIRPLPVLQKTMSYLLQLLDQPYSENFLGLYNFLWDRMRAIRMDLRMQHIFNRDAITMLEQMIRLHIVAMHELCECTKGEGFSEGFDAHLNIEQMNKTSVELFQLYDDHRKKGYLIPTEQEFRGYYALLKLDKHPGYKVEPAELSLELAKMTPEIRRTPEVVFARDVARACRTGNYISFFRLARKATYIQSCLMHAHFAKLRKQALASLHRGLQNNQGVPISHVVKWLAMEEEDVSNLLDYHGFLTKQFEEPYMVKEGPFLNNDNDYQAKCSQMVHLKKSVRIFDDIASCNAMVFPDKGQLAASDVHKLDHMYPSPVMNEVNVDKLDHEIPRHEDTSMTTEPCIEHVMPTKSSKEDINDCEMDREYVSVPSYKISDHCPPIDGTESSEPAAESTFPIPFLESNISSEPPSIRFALDEGICLKEASSYIHITNEVSLPHKPEANQLQCKEMIVWKRDEIANIKLKLILRRWKRRSSKRREIRELRHSMTAAALSSLTLGPPLRSSKMQVSHAAVLNIDEIAKERHKRYMISWSKLNPADVVGTILSRQNPHSNCLCWKLVICAQMDNTMKDNMDGPKSKNVCGIWLRSKLMGAKGRDEKELLHSSPAFSIWMKYLLESNVDSRICLSVVRELLVHDNGQIAMDVATLQGASAVLFLALEDIPWDLQKVRLYNLSMSIPAGSALPLLILCQTASNKEENHNRSFDIVKKLGLLEIDKSRIRKFTVISIDGNEKMAHVGGFLSDNNLREGLKWLADNSHTQPDLLQVTPYSLVRSFLYSCLRELDCKDDSQACPDDCIAAFNKALDQSLEEIMAAARANLSGWPCPEINQLLDIELRAMNLFLPTTGWSSDAAVGSIIRTIKSCKLPCFPHAPSFPIQDTFMDITNIQEQKRAFQGSLYSYLTKETKMMSEELAAKEACVLLQQGAALVLDGFKYRISPRWTAIFWRVFNYRMMNLNTIPSSVTYILSNRATNRELMDTRALVQNRGLREQGQLGWVTNLSLDEMIEICCRSQYELRSSIHEKLVESSPNDDKIVECNAIVENGGKLPESTVSGFEENPDENNNKIEVSKDKNVNKLSLLLERCNLLQNMIDEKLTIYF